MKDDLISRQAAIDAILHNQAVYSNNFGDDPIDKYTIAIIDNDAQTIAQLPSAQPKRSQGKWIPHKDEVMLFTGVSLGGVFCSICGWKTYNKMHLLFGCPYKYCPSCGADMREDK